MLKYRMHLEELKVKNKILRQNSTLLWNRHSEQFSLWLQEKVRAEQH